MGKRKAKQAEKAEQQEQKKARKKKRHPFRKLVFLLMIGGAGALILSEDVRNKALDALFGSEDEFQYSPPPAHSGDSAGDPSADA